MRLLGVELRRFGARRAVRWCALATVLYALVVGLVVASRPEDFAGAADVVRAHAPVLLVFAFAAGVTLVTAETGTGALGLWLTVEPRRGRVLASRLAAAALGAMVVLAVAYAVLAGGAYLVRRVVGGLGAIGTYVWVGLFQTGLALLLAGVLAALAGVALGVLLQRVTAVIGAVVAWFVVVEVGLVELVSSELWRWTFSAKLPSLVIEGDVNAAAFLLGAAVVLVLVAGVVLRRRDVV